MAHGRDDERFRGRGGHGERGGPRDRDDRDVGARRRYGTDLGFGSPDHEGAERGPHWGKGPKGWRRSDERLREDACEAIAAQGYVDASDVDVRAESSTIVLSGTVSHRGDKRLLERLVERVLGVEDVRNEIRIRRAPQATASAQRPRRDAPERHDGGAQT